MTTMQMIPPEQGETILDYITRLADSKHETRLSWETIADMANTFFNRNLDESTYRKWYKANNCVVTTKSQKFVETDNEEQWLNMQKLKAQVRDQRNRTNANIRRLSREDTLKEIAAECADKICAEHPIEFPKHIIIPDDAKTAILNIGDWHYGLTVNLHCNKFNADIAQKRIQKLVEDTILICKNNNVRKLIVNGMGDYISGRIHKQLDVNNWEDVMSQIMHVCDIIARMLNEFSKYFIVDFYNVFGNHARIEPNKTDSLQLENLERLVTWYAQRSLAGNKNINIIDNDVYDDISIFNVGPFCFGSVHGDKDKTSVAASQLSMFSSYKFDLIITAHKHHFAGDETNKCLVISNPSLIGTDDFAESLRVNATPAQTLIIVGKEQPMDCLYYINLDIQE